MTEKFNIIDLTHEISDKIPTWDGVPGMELEVTTDYKDCTPPDLFKVQKINCNAGIGTHIDAPAHCVPGGRTVDQLTVKELSADCIVFDLSAEANENFIITPSVLEKYEAEHGEIPVASFILFYTGWSKYWDTPKKYHNDHRFPSLDESAAKILIQRGVVGIGIDTLSCDTGAKGFPVHRAVLGADKYLVENIANANLLPLTGAKVIIAPMKITGAIEAPVRMIALI